MLSLTNKANKSQLNKKKVQLVKINKKHKMQAFFKIRTESVTFTLRSLGKIKFLILIR